MRIFADKQTIKQTDTNSKTEPHSYPLWIVGERANILSHFVYYKYLYPKGILSQINIYI